MEKGQSNQEMPQEIQDQWEVDVKYAVENIPAAVGQYERLLGDTAQIWSDLEENVECLQVPTQMEELQRHQERLKTELKTMSLIHNM